jgi:hypothetical protein
MPAAPGGPKCCIRQFRSTGRKIIQPLLEVVILHFLLSFRTSQRTIDTVHATSITPLSYFLLLPPNEVVVITPLIIQKGCARAGQKARRAWWAQMPHQTVPKHREKTNPASFLEVVIPHFLLSFRTSQRPIDMVRATSITPLSYRNYFFSFFMYFT